MQSTLALAGSSASPGACHIRDQGCGLPINPAAFVSQTYFLGAFHDHQWEFTPFIFPSSFEVAYMFTNTYTHTIPTFTHVLNSDKLRLTNHSQKYRIIHLPNTCAHLHTCSTTCTLTYIHTLSIHTSHPHPSTHGPSPTVLC